MENQNTSEWDEAFEAFERADLAYEAKSAEWDQANEELEKAAPRPEDYIDFGFFMFVDKRQLTHAMDLDEQVEKYRSRGWSTLSFAPATMETFEAKIDGVRQYRAALREAEASVSWNEINEQIDAVGEAVGDARDRALICPAPRPAALLWKLDQLLSERVIDSEDGEYIPAWHKRLVIPVMADARRFLSGEGA
ncbi:hypothetical protein WJT74_05250 [Sphingomicrobium sp. XHP0239]|uniref:hypothetical protein n=1 Tax=Sphingomicrobium maritimum TaxID=3133972 RepID=UPI0031CCBC8A